VLKSELEEQISELRSELHEACSKVRQIDVIHARNIELQRKLDRAVVGEISANERVAGLDRQIRTAKQLIEKYIDLRYPEYSITTFDPYALPTKSVPLPNPEHEGCVFLKLVYQQLGD
jgi:hypothetical protein